MACATSTQLKRGPPKQPRLRRPGPRSPGAHIVGPWVIDSINAYRDLRTGTQYVGNCASWVGLYNNPPPQDLVLPGPSFREW